MDKKSPDAFRTISEVADWLGVPTHVLRFWESRFTQVKPVKRAGGRRYYRPADMELLGGIRKLLHEDGMTIRGVQKLLREQGVKHVAAMSPPLESSEMRDSDGSNVVPLATSRTSTEASEEHAPEVTDTVSPDTVKAQTDHQDILDDTPVSEPEPEPEAAEHDSPPTLTDAADDSDDNLVEALTDKPSTEVIDDEPAERDLFAAETTPEPETLEHDHEPTELEADVAEAGSVEEIDEINAPASGDVESQESATQEAPDTSEPEVAAPAEPVEPVPAIEPDPSPIAPPPSPLPIDISHISDDVADDAFATSQSVSISAKLRAFRSSGGVLPDDKLSSLTARLSDLAIRMAPAPSDNGQAE
ncbi:MerR family transcriptional regulator [Aliiroseovarius sp. S253]|uniref:MerR family transcriptional regulator n=1 Tax=Aliiroseovarius sp. S253 TaxID=3415133 RepID=UPI003C7C5D3A